MKYRYPLVEIVWDDAKGDSGWSDPPEELKPTHVRQIGFLVKESESHLFLCAAYVDDGTADKQVSSTDKIPKGMIKSQKMLNVSEKRPRKVKEVVSS